MASSEEMSLFLIPSSSGVIDDDIFSVSSGGVFLGDSTGLLDSGLAAAGTDDDDDWIFLTLLISSGLWGWDWDSLPWSGGGREGGGGLEVVAGGSGEGQLLPTAQKCASMEVKCMVSGCVAIVWDSPPCSED